MNGRINIQKRGNMVLVAALFFMLVITEAAKGELPAQKAAEESTGRGADMAADAGNEDGTAGEGASGTDAVAEDAAEMSISGEEQAGTEQEAQAVPAEYLIEDFPVILQMPELPTGCEITALTMVLNYYGFAVDKTVMAAEYLPTAGMGLYYGADGRLYGTDPEELYRLVSEDQPVAVWVTISMADWGETGGWYTEDGEYVDWSRNDHGAVLIGYSGTTVTIADPISGQIEYDRQQFEEVFADRGNRCVVIG